ncbi:MAG: hypothetical protein AABZ48_04260, partial [candidate division NC10 bacterium]
TRNHESINNASTLFAREKNVKASFLRIPREFARRNLEEASPEREIFAVPSPVDDGTIVFGAPVRKSASGRANPAAVDGCG